MSRLSNALAAFSAASAAIEAEKIREALEEQNYILNDLRNTAKAATANQNAQLDTDSANPIEYLKSQITLLNIKKNKAIQALIFPFNLPASFDTNEHYIEHVATTQAQKWKFTDIPESLKLMMSMVTQNDDSIPDEIIQELVATLVFSRDLVSPAESVYEYENCRLQNIVPIGSAISSALFKENANINLNELVVPVLVELHGRKFDLKISGPEGVFIALLFTALGQFTNMDSASRLNYIGSNSHRIGTSEFYNNVKGDSVGSILEYILNNKLGFDIISAQNTSKLQNRK